MPRNRFLNLPKVKKEQRRPPVNRLFYTHESRFKSTKHYKMRNIVVRRNSFSETRDSLLKF